MTKQGDITRLYVRVNPQKAVGTESAKVDIVLRN
jgi:hypothetical protein